MKTTPRITAVALLGIGICLFGGSVALAEIGPSTAFGGTNVVAPTITTYTTKIIAEYADGEVVEIPVKEGQDPNSIKIPPKKMKQKALKNSGTRAKKVALGAAVLIVVGTGLLVASKRAERNYRRKFLAEQELAEQAQIENTQVGAVEAVTAEAVAAADQASPKEEASNQTKQTSTEETSNQVEQTTTEETNNQTEQTTPEETNNQTEQTTPEETNNQTEQTTAEETINRPDKTGADKSAGAKPASEA